MPGGDRPGPEGKGPMTGWGGGYCSGDSGSVRSGMRGGRVLSGGSGAGRSAGWRFAMGAGRFVGRCLAGGLSRGRRNRFLATGIPGRTWRRQPGRSRADTGFDNKSATE